MPDDSANRRSLAIDPVDGNSSRATLAVTITAFVSVSESCGNTATSKLRQTSGQRGTTSCGRPGVTATDDAIPTWPVIHPVRIAAPSASGAAGQCGTRVSAKSNASDPKPSHGVSRISVRPSTAIKQPSPS